MSGNPNAVMTYIKGGKTIRVEVFCETEEEARGYLNYFGGSVREVKSEDWVSKQADTRRPPIKIRDRLIITDRSDENDLEKLRKAYPHRGIITIPAEMAFGTGDHATTSTCLRLLCDYVEGRSAKACDREAKEAKGGKEAKESNGDKEKKESKGTESRPWSLLDIGCGSGILAIGASLLGAESCKGFDFDDVAVRVAQKNVLLNKTQNVELFEADVFSWKPEGTQQTWDLVVANLFSTILQRAFPIIRTYISPEGNLIVSGILATQWEETKFAGEQAGLKFLRVIKRGKWVSAFAELTHS